jgi:hypothetical protein
MNDLPKSFRHIRLELAREPGNPEGDADHGYDILAPLDEDYRIDADTQKAHVDACRVRRFIDGETDAVGLLRHGPGGRWYFDYDPDRDDDDETGYRFGEERFVMGEYVSLADADGDMHTFRVTLVETL